MSPVEIIFVVLGILLLVISCFVTGRKEEPETVSVPVPAELTQEQGQKLKEEVDRILEERTDYLVVKADDYLSKISNEKIMAVHDFTDQIMKKIDVNHQEVVFLYDMLNQKETEIKETVQALEEEKKSLKESVEDVIQLTKQLNAIVKRAEVKQAVPSAAPSPAGAVEEVLPKEKAKKVPEKKQTRKPAGKTKAKTETKAGHDKQESAVLTEEQMELPHMMQTDNKNEEILKLYRQGKSVLEISKALGLGQGEVKLVIGLYGPI